MKNENAQDTVKIFLESSIPEETRTSYELLAGLQFPLNDYAGFEQQVGKQRADPQCSDAWRDAADRVLASLGPDDFPIVTAQSALEKYSNRLPLDRVFRFFPYGSPWNRLPPNPRVGDDVWRDYWVLFGPDCHITAFGEYRFALRNGLSEVAAFEFGYRAGSRCLQNRRMPPPMPPPGP